MTGRRPAGPRGAAPRLLAPRTWRPWSRQVALRGVLLLGSWLFWAGYLLYALTDRSPLGSDGTPGAVPQTMYQEQPGLTRAIFTLAALALLVETASVLWRVARHSHRPGVTGMAVGVLGGIVSILGILTIGVFVLPFVTVCVLLALPIDARVPESSVAPPGWYGDPTGRPQWRYWDGGVWTGFVATDDGGMSTVAT